MDITSLIDTLIYTAFVVIGIFLIIYLTYVLIHPDRF
ncbi:MAG: potassium-transporting ATPase subunit F [Halobacteriota archaeon]